MLSRQDRLSLRLLVTWVGIVALGLAVSGGPAHPLGEISGKSRNFGLFRKPRSFLKSSGISYGVRGVFGVFGVFGVRGVRGVGGETGVVVWAGGKKRDKPSDLRRMKRLSRACLILIDGENVRGCPKIRFRLSKGELESWIETWAQAQQNGVASHIILHFDSEDDGAARACRRDSGMVVVHSGSSVRSDDLIAAHIPMITALETVVILVITEDEALLRRALRAGNCGVNVCVESHMVSNIRTHGYNKHINLLRSTEFVCKLEASCLESPDISSNTSPNIRSNTSPNIRPNTSPNIMSNTSPNITTNIRFDISPT
mmetsp:Transcript_21418/g.33824  ORF Transcript_21418/g.33824 Transcript_21418/m.33824 type:complete len:314 (-) Transcript_21418:128-1069(-)